MSSTYSSSSPFNKRRRLMGDETAGSSNVGGETAATTTVVCTSINNNTQEMPPMTLSSVFDTTPLALNVVSYLSGKEMMSLQQVNQTLNRFTKLHQDELFASFLCQDFPEGQLLQEAFVRSRRDLPSRKTIYRAFHQRFRLSQVKKKRVVIPWQRPPKKSAAAATNVPMAQSSGTVTSTATETTANQSKIGSSIDQAQRKENGNEAEGIELASKMLQSKEIEDEDDQVFSLNGEEFERFQCLEDAAAESLVFVFRAWDCPESCGFLGWKHHLDEDHPHRSYDTLDINEEWLNSNCTEGIYWPPLENQLCRDIDALANSQDHGSDEARSERLLQFKAVEKEMCEKYQMTVHVVDVDNCKIMTLIEDAPGKSISDMYSESFEVCSHADSLPHLYGMPHQGSPFYRSYSEKDFDYMEREQDFYDFPKVENLRLWSYVTLGRFFDHQRPSPTTAPGGYDDTIYTDSITFLPSDTSSMKVRSHICSYLRSLMKQKCVYDPLDNEKIVRLHTKRGNIPPMTHADWLTTRNVLDTVLSFVSLEDQTSVCREVCTHFKQSIVRLLANKALGKNRIPVGFDRFDWGGCFAAYATHGWTNDFSSRNKVIDYTLRTMTCRCDTLCSNLACCPGSNAGFRYLAQETTKSMKIDEARRLLEQYERFNLEEKYSDGSVMVSFKKIKSQNLYQLCRNVAKDISKQVEYRTMRGYFGQHWGVEDEDMSLRQFLRRIFLVFTDGASPTDGHFTEITIAKMKWHYFVQNMDNPRSLEKIVYRFTTASGENVEISMITKPYSQRH